MSDRCDRPSLSVRVEQPRGVSAGLAVKPLEGLGRDGEAGELRSTRAWASSRSRGRRWGSDRDPAGECGEWAGGQATRQGRLSDQDQPREAVGTSEPIREHPELLEDLEGESLGLIDGEDPVDPVRRVFLKEVGKVQPGRDQPFGLGQTQGVADQAIEIDGVIGGGELDPDRPPTRGEVGRGSG